LQISNGLVYSAKNEKEKALMEKRQEEGRKEKEKKHEKYIQ